MMFCWTDVLQILLAVIHIVICEQLMYSNSAPHPPDGSKANHPPGTVLNHPPDNQRYLTHTTFLDKLIATIRNTNSNQPPTTILNRPPNGSRHLLHNTKYIDRLIANIRNTKMDKTENDDTVSEQCLLTLHKLPSLFQFANKAEPRKEMHLARKYLFTDVSKKDKGVVLRQNINPRDFKGSGFENNAGYCQNLCALCNRQESVLSFRALCKIECERGIGPVYDACITLVADSMLPLST